MLCIVNLYRYVHNMLPQTGLKFDYFELYAIFTMSAVYNNYVLMPLNSICALCVQAAFVHSIA